MTEPDPLVQRDFVRGMFDRIAGRYDLLNHLLSAGTDVSWRRTAVHLLDPQPGWHVLDLATGTGDFAFETASRQNGSVLVTGADLSMAMLRIGLRKRGGRRVDLLCCDAEGLPFRDKTFNGVTIGFGIRNVARLESGLGEMWRILKPGGRAVVLEFSKPRAVVLKDIFNFYFKNILPRIGALISKDKMAYTYLYESVIRFPEGGDFVSAMVRAGFRSVREHRLTFGIATAYVGERIPSEWRP